MVMAFAFYFMCFGSDFLITSMYFILKKPKQTNTDHLYMLNEEYLKYRKWKKEIKICTNPITYRKKHE